jgi:hypothetical protein
VYQAQERQLSIQKKKGTLVDRARAETLVFRLARQERDVWVTWPTRVAALPPVHSCRPTREADLPVKFHAENAPVLPDDRKGQSGKVLLCPQHDYPATSAEHFCTAVLR